MKKTFYLFSIFTVLFASCSGGNQADDSLLGTKETVDEIPAEPKEVNWEQLSGAEVPAEEFVVLEGYVGDIGSYVDQSYGRMTIAIVERRNQKAGFKLHVSMEIGSTPNHVNELPDQFSPDDFKIVCKGGEIVTTGAKVRITGVMESAISRDYISLRLTEIESLEDNFNSAVFDRAQALTEEMVHDTSLHSVYCYLEGKLDLPTIIFSLTNDNSIDLKATGVKSITSVDIRVGTGPGTMDELPDNYTNNDLVVRDFEGNPVPVNSKVRLYGVWERYDFESGSEGRFYLEEVQVK